MSDTEKDKKSFCSEMCPEGWWSVSSRRMPSVTPWKREASTRLSQISMFGHKTGLATGFSYTDDNKNKGITWGEVH
jgi:hypothetical protein